MDLSQARRFQSLAGRAGLMVGILLVAAMLDVVIARHRTDFNVMHVLPGPGGAHRRSLSRKNQRRGTHLPERFAGPEGGV